MKKLFLFLIIMVVLTAASPVLANSVEPIGPWLGRAEVVFPADTPFHITHGWNSTGMANPHPDLSYKYALDLDGVPLKADIFEILEDPDTGMFYWLWTFNFPDGLTGAHTFTHHWYGHCKEFIEGCTSNAVVEINQEIQIVNFIAE